MICSADVSSVFVQFVLLVTALLEVKCVVSVRLVHTVQEVWALPAKGVERERHQWQSQAPVTNAVSLP